MTGARRTPQETAKANLSGRVREAKTEMRLLDDFDSWGRTLEAWRVRLFGPVVAAPRRLSCDYDPGVEPTNGSKHASPHG